MKKSLLQFWVTGDADFKRRVKAEAAARGVEMSDLIREALDLFFGGDDRRNGRPRGSSNKPIRYTSIKD